MDLFVFQFSSRLAVGNDLAPKKKLLVRDVILGWKIIGLSIKIFLIGKKF